MAQKRRFNNTNEAEYYGKTLRRQNVDGIAGPEISTLERCWEQRKAQIQTLERVTEEHYGLNGMEVELLEELIGELSFDAQFYNEALMYARGERE